MSGMIIGSPPVRTTWRAGNGGQTRIDDLFDGERFALGIPTRIRRIAPDAAEITAAGADEDGRNADEFAFALDGMEKFGDFHEGIVVRGNDQWRDSPDASALVQFAAATPCASVQSFICRPFSFSIISNICSHRLRKSVKIEHFGHRTPCSTLKVRQVDRSVNGVERADRSE